jgi:hypothetical protein
VAAAGTLIATYPGAPDGTGLREPEPAAMADEPTGPTCPSCAIALERTPTRDRLCPSCRQRIVVRHVDGRIVLLTAEAAPIVDAHLQHEADERQWEAERTQWLTRAGHVWAPDKQLARLSAAPISAAVVEQCRKLYRDSADRAVRVARRKADWSIVARVRRDEAAALFAAAGHPVPPPDQIVALQREGMLAELHALAETTQFAELVGTRCCPACRSGDGQSARIATELRAPRLPHEGCPKGICACEWYLSTTAPRRSRRRPRAA